MKINRLTRILALPICLATISTASADWSSTISAANPLHWFRFEESAGSAVADDQGSADIDGSYFGGVALEAAGLVGNAAFFDGTDGHVLVGGPDLSADWTVESIFKVDTDIGGASQGMLGADFTATDRMALKAEQWNETGQLGFTVFGVIDVTYTDPSAVTPADYTHVVFVGTGAGIELFVNGISLGADTSTTPLSRHVLGAGAVRADGSLIDALTGTIDELVIYDRALSTEEIAAHAAAAVPEPSTLLLAIVALGVLPFLRRIAM